MEALAHEQEHAKPYRSNAFVKGNSVSRPMAQVVQLQDLAFNLALGEEIDSKAFSGLARAWCDLEERRRVLTGKPLPGSYRPEKKSKTGQNPFTALKAMKRIDQTKAIDIKSEPVDVVIKPSSPS